MNTYETITISGREPDLHEEIRIALGHLKVHPEDIEASFARARSPNVSRPRRKLLSELLNDVVRHGVRHPEHRSDLLVLPEVSVPHRWASFVSRWAREHQIGVICGLEHRVDAEGRAWNELLAALPFRRANGSKDCVSVRRLKRHYSPEEEFQLNNNERGIPRERGRSRYQIFRWRGASFAVYNCYELASVEDRGLFKSKVDFIVCSEFNKDVNYFSNIVESASRDLHCYVVQVNSSHFGDSRIVSPSKTEEMNPLRIKGGDNQTFLAMRLPLKELRSHQMRKYGLQKESRDYKPAPPDFDAKEVLARVRLGQRTIGGEPH